MPYSDRDLSGFLFEAPAASPREAVALAAGAENQKSPHKSRGISRLPGITYPRRFEGTPPFTKVFIYVLIEILELINFLKFFFYNIYYQCVMYARRYLKRKKPVKKSFTKGTPLAYKAMTLATRTANVVNKLSSMVNCEKKETIYATTTYPTLSSPTIAGLVSIAEGTGEDERVGRKILLDSITIRWRVLASSSMSNDSEFCRILLIADKENPSAVPAITDIFQTTDPDSWYLKDNKTRFVTLYSKRFVISKDAKDGVMGSIYEKLNFHCLYDGNTASDYAENSLFLIFQTTEPTNTPAFHYNMKLTWYDN